MLLQHQYGPRISEQPAAHTNVAVQTEPSPLPTRAGTPAGTSQPSQHVSPSLEPIEDHRQPSPITFDLPDMPSPTPSEVTPAADMTRQSTVSTNTTAQNPQQTNATGPPAPPTGDLVLISTEEYHRHRAPQSDQPNTRQLPSWRDVRHDVPRQIQPSPQLQHPPRPQTTPQTPRPQVQYSPLLPRPQH